MARQTPPLNYNLPMVDPETGVPTPFFMRWWQDQIDTNLTIPTLETADDVSGVLDILGTPSQGQILFRGVTLWELLDAGIAGQSLLSGGPGADPYWGNVTVSFLDLTDTPGSYVGDTGKIPAVNSLETALEFQTLTEILDRELGSTHGAIAFRNATEWVILAPGVSGRFLKTLGAGNDPVWDVASGGSSTFTGLSDTPANYTSEAGKVTRVNSGETALEFATLTELLDALGTTQGMIIYRNSTSWVALTAGSNGQVLTSNGPTSNPSWQTPSGGGGGGGSGHTLTLTSVTGLGTDEVIDISDYDEVYITLNDALTSTSAAGDLTLSSDGGSTYESSYQTASVATGSGESHTSASTVELLFGGASSNAHRGWFNIRHIRDATIETRIDGWIMTSNFNVAKTALAAAAAHDRIKISTGGNALTSGSIDVVGVQYATATTPTMRGFRATPSTTQSGHGSFAVTELVLGTEDWDTENAFASNRFTVPADLDGEYMSFYAGIKWSANKSGACYIERSTDSGSSWTAIAQGGFITQDADAFASGPHLLATGDIYRVTFAVSSGSNTIAAPTTFFSGFVN